MIEVGLTGGIGSGKSTVSAMLARRGAVVIDADEIVRDLQRAGSPVLAAMAERFGPGIIRADGELDRPAMAAIAFADAQALADLNGIVHPAMRAESARRTDAYRGTDRVVVHDVALLTELPRPGLQAIIVVDLPEELQVERLVRYRGFTEADARARMARQASRAQRLATATHVIDNSGDLPALERQVEDLWAELQLLPQRQAPRPD